MAFNCLVELLQNRDYNHFSDLFAKDIYSQENAEDILSKWKSLSNTDKIIFGDGVKENITTHSSVTRIQEIHWRDRNHIATVIHM